VRARVRWEQHVLQLNKFGKLARGWMESRVGGTKDIDTNFCHHCTLATSAKDVSCFNYFIWSLLGTMCVPANKAKISWSMKHETQNFGSY
jgi:hypothetical protein